MQTHRNKADAAHEVRRCLSPVLLLPSWLNPCFSLRCCSRCAGRWPTPNMACCRPTSSPRTLRPKWARKRTAPRCRPIIDDASSSFSSPWSAIDSCGLSPASPARIKRQRNADRVDRVDRLFSAATNSTDNNIVGLVRVLTYAERSAGNDVKVRESHCLSLTSHCLSLTSYCVFHCRTLTFRCLSPRTC